MSTKDRLTKEQRQELKRIHSVASGFQFTSLYPQEVKFLFNLINELAPEPKPIEVFALVDTKGGKPFFYSSSKEEVKRQSTCYEERTMKVIKLVEQPLEEN